MQLQKTMRRIAVFLPDDEAVELERLAHVEGRKLSQMAQRLLVSAIQRRLKEKQSAQQAA